jgi:acyl dehydratase
LAGVGFSEASVGLRYRMTDYYEIGREKVREFATAVQDEHPAHFREEAAAELGFDGLLAPLTFVSIIGVLAHHDFFASLGIDDSRMMMQTDQRFVFYKPIVVGDRILGEIEIESFRQIAGTEVIVTKNNTWNQRGELVQTAYTTLICRPDESDDTSEDLGS